MAENPDSEKHQALRAILETFGIPVLPGYFSEGSTITANALYAIRDEVQHLTARVQTAKDALNDI